MRDPNNDPNFETFRRDRQRQRVESGATAPPVGPQSDAVRQLEQAEERELQDRQLSREVHDFFTAATEKAANIVSQVAEAEEEESSGRLVHDMEDFLMDALRRMNVFVQAILATREGPAIEAILEPQMSNLVGPLLDQFRAAGTAMLADKHFGQDPFAADPEEIQHELEEFRELKPAEQAHVVPLHSASEPEPDPADPHFQDRSAAHDIENHLVAEVNRKEEPEPQAPLQAAGEADPNDIQRFKKVLKGLIQKGLMTQEEARAAWLAKKATLGG